MAVNFLKSIYLISKSEDLHGWKVKILQQIIVLMVHDGLLFAAGSRQAVNVHGNGGGLARYWKSDEIAMKG